MKIFLLFLSIAILNSVCLAQSPSQIKELTEKIPSLAGVEKARAYETLISFYQRTDLKEAEIHRREMEKFAAAENSPAINTYLLLVQGQHYNTSGLLDSALSNFERSRQLATSVQDTTAMIKAYASLGRTWIGAGKAENGLRTLYTCLSLITRPQDAELGYKTRVNVTWAYLELKQYRDCIRFGQESLDLMPLPEYSWIALYIYNNMAVSYGALNNLDSARILIEKSISIARKNNELHALANAHFILGTVYREAGQYKKAIDEYLKAKPYREKTGNPSFLIADLYTISELYHKTGNYAAGVHAGQEALALAQQYNLLLKFETTYEALAKNYEGLNDYKNASKYFQLLAAAKDSVYLNANAEALADMRTRYETEKKEQALSHQKTELERQRAQLRNTYTIIIALFVIAALITLNLVLLRSHYRKRQLLLEQEHALADRQTYMRATISSQEQERKRFAKDLHDGMGQLISLLRMMLSGITSNASASEQSHKVSQCEDVLNQMYREIRGLAFNLMPQTLIQQGLVNALQEMASQVNNAGKVKLTVSSFDLPDRLHEVQEISLYRILQEWANNVIKYSGASVIAIQLVGYADEINITVEDNGAGFDPSLLDNSSGQGWQNIQSRLTMLAGSVYIDSKPGTTGTTLIIRVPAKLQGQEHPEYSVGANTH